MNHINPIVLELVSRSDKCLHIFENMHRDNLKVVEFSEVIFLKEVIFFLFQIDLPSGCITVKVARQHRIHFPLRKQPGVKVVCQNYILVWTVIVFLFLNKIAYLMYHLFYNIKYRMPRSSSLIYLI